MAAAIKLLQLRTLAEINWETRNKKVIRKVHIVSSVCVCTATNSVAEWTRLGLFRRELGLSVDPAYYDLDSNWV